jgi:phospholipase/lecithinase/hemolysin
MLTVQIGSALDLSFTPEELLSNRIVQNQTSTAEGGPNYVEFITGCGVKPGLTNPRYCSKQLWDFAFGGADISTAYTPLHHNYTTSLVNQTVQCERYADPVLSNFIDKRRSLVSFWIGINDINDSAKYEVDFPSFYDKLIGTLFERIERIYSLGYKNFLLMKLPPLDRTPSNQKRTSGPLPNATMIEWYNDALAHHSEEFQRSRPSTKVMVYDTTKFLNNVLDDPTRYGIKNTTDFCAAYDQPNINADPGSYGCQPLDEFL